MAAACVLMAGALAPACYLSHRIEPAAVPPDAGRRDAGAIDAPPGPPPDVGPGPAGYWTLERRDARLGIEHELGCTQHEGGRIALTVTAPLTTTCEHAGPIETARDAEGTLRVTAFVWVEHRAGPSACPGVAALAERTLLLPASEGTFRAASDDGGSRVEYRVGAIDDLPCTRAGPRDAPCLLDCQCQSGLVCIPQLGDFVACDGGHCGDACTPEAGSLPPVYGQHLECDASEVCAPGAAISAFRCAPIADGGCDPGAPACGAGLSCPTRSGPTECDWTLRLSAMTRHPCAADGDCDAGLYCVEHEGGARSCEVPCFTNEMRCPAMHECRGERWVCEWIGE